MELIEFFEKVEEHENLQGLGIDKEKGELAVLCIAGKQTTMLQVEAILEADWQTLEAILLGKREPQVLYHMTRVVGYYSRVDNWNPSKLAELRDRQAGVYG